MLDSSSIDWPRLKRSLDRPLLFLASIALATLILGHILGVTTWELVEHHLHWSLRLLFGLLVFVGASAWLRVHRFSHHWNFAAFTAALTAGHWLAMDFHHLLAHSFHLGAAWIVVIAFAGFFACRTFHHHAREQWKNWVTFAREPSEERVKKDPVKHLVLFLSPPTTVPRKELDGKLTFANEKGVWAATTGNIGEDIDIIDQNGFHNWLPPLRGIQPHTSTLETLWIVVSKFSSMDTPSIAPPGEKALNAHGSGIYGELAKHWLQTYLPGCKIKVSESLDFEDFKSMLQYVREEILGTLHPHSRHELAIDITGGMKITSVLGAFLTANDQAVFQYVQTLAADGKKPTAQIYDIRHDSGPEIPG